MRHYEQKHFVCDHPACVGQAFSVFNTRLELMEHKKLVHRERETLHTHSNYCDMMFEINDKIFVIVYSSQQQPAPRI